MKSEPASTAFHASDEQFRVTLASIGDGVVVTDTEGRLTFLNRVAEELTGWKLQEAEGRPMRDVFRIVDERTRQPIKDPVQRVLREGRVIGIGNHTILIARDGTERPIEDSAAPVVENGGEIRGVVLVFRDATERRQAERQAQWVAALIQHSSVAIIGKDLNGRVTSWNDAAEKMFGYAAQEMIGESITRLYPPERLQEEERILAQLRQGEPVEVFDTIRVRKDGRRFPMRASMAPIRDADGQVVGASSIARDISKEREAAEQYRVTLTSIGDGVIVTNPEGEVTFMNPVAEELTGWKSGDTAKRPLREILRVVDEDSHEPIEDLIAKVMQAGGHVGLGSRNALIARDGSRRPIDATAAPVRDSGGLILGIVVVFRDVSQRRLAELDTQRLAAIVEYSIDAIIAKDLDGKITSWNRAAERIYGYTAAEMIGYSAQRLLPHDRLDEEDRVIDRIKLGEIVPSFESFRIAKDGRQLYMRLSISPIRDRSGRIIGFSKIARDITRQREANQRLETMQAELAAHARMLESRVQARTAELEEKVAELEAFSYSLSHDMRAPLRAITSFTELVLTDHSAQLDPEATNHLRRVTNAALRMDRLIQDVLAFSRLSQRVVVSEPVDVTRLVDDLVFERPELQPPRAEIRIDRPLIPMLGHPALLTQALGNLLDNAVKFVARGVVPQVRIWTEPLGAEVRLWVEDNGIGISREAQRRLFMLFQRLNPTSHYEGMGIGLAIVRKAARRMNGQAGVESEPNRGSRFWIQLPKA